WRGDGVASGARRTALQPAYSTAWHVWGGGGARGQRRDDPAASCRVAAVRGDQRRLWLSDPGQHNPAEGRCVRHRTGGAAGIQATPGGVPPMSPTNQRVSFLGGAVMANSRSEEDT